MLSRSTGGAPIATWGTASPHALLPAPLLPGAGAVGVELVGEILTVYPSKHVIVVDFAKTILPGVDEALVGACVGSKLRLTWNKNSPPPLSAEDAPLLPAGSSIVFDIEILSIKYQLFGEKMRLPQLKQATIDYMFAPEPLSLRSPVDERGHQNADRVPLVQTDNPFAVAPNQVSLITNPANTLAPLWQGLREQFGF